LVQLLSLLKYVMQTFICSAHSMQKLEGTLTAENIVDIHAFTGPSFHSILVG